MDTPIRNLDFDSSGDNTEYGIHRCANSDGDSSCSFGITSWNAGDGDRVYFGKSVSGFGKDGCPNPACVEEQKALRLQMRDLAASIAILDRAIQATPVQLEKITLGTRKLETQRNSVGDADPNGGASPDAGAGGNGGTNQADLASRL